MSYELLVISCCSFGSNRFFVGFRGCSFWSRYQIARFCCCSFGSRYRIDRFRCCSFWSKRFFARFCCCSLWSRHRIDRFCCCSFWSNRRAARFGCFGGGHDAKIGICSGKKNEKRGQNAGAGEKKSVFAPPGPGDSPLRRPPTHEKRRAPCRTPSVRGAVIAARRPPAAVRSTRRTP